MESRVLADTSGVPETREGALVGGPDREMAGGSHQAQIVERSRRFRKCQADVSGPTANVAAVSKSPGPLISPSINASVFSAALRVAARTLAEVNVASGGS